MKTWKEDREKLREALRLGLQNKTLSGLEATFLCVLVAHMHGKLHMKSYAAKTGGWRSGYGREIAGPTPPVFQKRYGAAAAVYYAGSQIASLEDQAAWIAKYQYEVDFDPSSLQLLAQVVYRVLSKSWNQGEELEKEPKEPEVLSSPSAQGSQQRFWDFLSRLPWLHNSRKDVG